MSTLKILGEVSIVPCSDIDLSGMRILIMGPTGAGKSAFIEALAGPNTNLGISKDQLAGFTQHVNAYEVTGTKVNYRSYSDEDTGPVYLIDTPGFSDSKIPELQIVNGVKDWMTENGLDFIYRVFYLCPITDPRVPGSKRRMMKMLKSLIGLEQSAKAVVLVTTMWDTIGNPDALSRAETRFEQLRDDVWKEFVSQGTQIVRFDNTVQSALEIISQSIRTTGFSLPLHSTPVSSVYDCAPFLYEELIDRIHNCRQQETNLHLERIHLLAAPDKELDGIVTSKLHEILEDLGRFLGQVTAFGEPPPGFERVPKILTYQRLIDHVKEDMEYKAAIKHTLANLGAHTGDEDRVAFLQTELAEVKRKLELSSKALVEYGDPPEGHELGLAPYSALSYKYRLKQVVRQGKDSLLSAFNK